MRVLTQVALLACTAAAATPAILRQEGPKQSAQDRLATLEQEIHTRKSAGQIDAELDRLKAEYVALRRELAPHRSGGSQANGAAPRVISPVCPGTGTDNTLWTDSVGGPIPDLTTVSYTLGVSSPTTYLWDLDLTTNITHTWNSDLDITLTSPAGTVATVSTDNGDWFIDVFNGTSWDDFWVNAEVTDHTGWADFTTATPLNPEGSFDLFRGEDPNGTWTITITDDVGGDFGNLSSWSLSVTTIAAAPSTSSVTVASSPNLPISAGAPPISVSDSVLVAGAGLNVVDVQIMILLTHTWNADLEIFLTSPLGTVVNVSTNNGGSADDVFNGTIFDESDPTPVSDVAFVDGVAVTSCSPEGAFANFMGEDPNGTWTLRVDDTANLDGGVFASWSLTVTTCAGCAVTDICEPLAPDVTDGCTPDVSWTGSPDVGGCTTPGTEDFFVTFGAMSENKNCNVIIGKGAAVTAPWATESNRCFPAPYSRTGAQDTGDVNGAAACGGEVTLDVEGYLQGGNPLLTPVLAGDTFVVQAWYRDPASTKTTQMSDAAAFTVCP